MKSSLLLAIVVFSLTSFAQESEPKIEPLLGYVNNSEGLTFQVFSGGCTGKDSFYIQFENQDNNQLAIALYRKTPDYCRAYYPYGKLIYFSYEELGIKTDQRFKISNQIQSSHRGNY